MACLLIATTLLTVGCVSSDFNMSDMSQDKAVYIVTNNDISIEFNDLLHSRVSSRLNGDVKALGSYQSSEFIETKDGQRITDFAFKEKTEKVIETEIGKGLEVNLTGISLTGLQKTVSVSTYEKFPSMAFFKVTYQNNAKSPLEVRRWVNNHYNLAQYTFKSRSKNLKNDDFWSYEGASYADRRDWVKPIAIGYKQDNYMGMNATDYGSGTAIVDVWRSDLGIAVGHSEITPKLVALPLRYESKKTGAELHIELEKMVSLAPGALMQTLETFVNIHSGDYYSTLKNYRQVMAAKGLTIDDAPDSAYEPIWCAWGYERNFSPAEVLATLPKAKELGLKWAVLDDGWQTAEGDWYLSPEKFPGGDKDMTDFVSKINEAGLKAKLWWAPLAVDPGTDLLHEHSDMLLLDENGAVQDITWWNSFYLCPAYEGTREHTKELVKKIMGEWGYAGLKIDGQHLNGVPACYNPAHNHAYPEESVEKLPDYWKMVYETALEINPEAVVEICPCGTSYAFHNLPYMNQAVSSDPLSSWQVRHKGKTLKGLMGDSIAYYGDHVELSDNANDFASSVGIGAVVGTKFTIPNHDHADFATNLDDDKEPVWAKWIDIYQNKMLPKGVYMGELYDIGFDLPETHAIKKDDRLYYAFYADDWSGSVELRGLTVGRYQVMDYFNNEDLGTVEGPTVQFDTKFENFLLLELIPVK